MLNLSMYSDDSSDEEDYTPMKHRLPPRVETSKATTSVVPVVASPTVEPAAEPTPKVEREAPIKHAYSPPWRLSVEATGCVDTAGSVAPFAINTHLPLPGSDGGLVPQPVVPPMNATSCDKTAKPGKRASSSKLAGKDKEGSKKAQEGEPEDSEMPPAPWYRKESSKHAGRYYYVNSVTKETVWKMPERPMVEESDLSETEPESEGAAEEEAPQATHTLQAGLGQRTNLCAAELMRWRTVAEESPRKPFLIAAEMTAATGPHWSPRETKTARETCSWRRKAAEHACQSPKGSAAKPLQVSEGSWTAQQRARRGTVEPVVETEDDAEIVRRIKSILNKLTIEKFPQLSRQLLEVNFRCLDHVNILIKEVFEKATTQHHYIDMYTNLCELLHEFFSQNPVSTDPKSGFKRLLLNECQRSFERNLEPPSNLEKLDAEERTLAEVRYKTRMLGNIRFVGALLARHMLASKVLIAILEDLMSIPSSEALETVAALLTVTGPVFDNTEWPHRPALVAIFAQVKEIVQKKNCTSRVRFLMRDVLELRSRGWKNSRPSRMETPTTLQAVAEKAEEETKVVWR
jgi:hypothetical protein